MSNGNLSLTDKNKFTVRVRLDQLCEPNSWKVVDIVLHIQSNRILATEECYEDAIKMSRKQMDILCKTCDERLKHFSNEEYFENLYQILHSFCLKLHLDTLTSEFKRIKDSLSIDASIEHETHKVMKFSYWKNETIIPVESQIASSLCHGHPFLSISIDTNEDLLVSHSPPLETLSNGSVNGSMLLSNNVSAFIVCILTHNANHRIKMLYNFLLESDFKSSYKNVTLEKDSLSNYYICITFFGVLECHIQFDHYNGKLVINSSRASEDQYISILLKSVETLVNTDCSRIHEHLKMLKKHSLSEYFIKLAINSGLSVSRRFPFEARNLNIRQ